jgi:regulator of sigma E protease
MNIPVNILALVFVLSFLIVFHEGGHFAVAKLFRFPVEVFSLGFGKRLFGFRRRETDYRVSLIPLGGYVKVVGLGPDESDVVDGTASTAPVQPGTRLQRLLILVAGPGVNLVLALLLTAFALMLGVDVARYIEEKPVVKHVDVGSPAEAAGIKVDDTIVKIAGRPVSTWREVETDLGLSPHETVPVEVTRQAQSMVLQIKPEPQSKFEKSYDIGYTGLHAYIPAVVGEVIPGYPAAKAGLAVDDKIVSVGGKDVDGYHEVVRQVREASKDFKPNAAQPIAFVVQRAASRETLQITPTYVDGWKIGFRPKNDLVKLRLPFLPALAASFRENVQGAKTTFQIVGRLFRGRGSMRQFSGPIDIARMSGDSARTGPAALLTFMGMLSLQLGILNLLPIPLLDGGQIFVTLLESLARRDFSLKVKERLLQAGFVFLVLVMVTVLYFDVVKNI